MTSKAEIKSYLSEIKSYVSDTFLMSQCVTFTADLIKVGMDSNEVLKVVAEYQRCYILLKNNKIPEDILKTFTTEMWWKSRDCR
jgi:hypothetical protein